MCRREVPGEVLEFFIVKQTREVGKVILKSCSPLKPTFSPPAGDGGGEHHLVNTTKESVTCLVQGLQAEPSTVVNYQRCMLAAKWNHPRGKVSVSLGGQQIFRNWVWGPENLI